MSFSRATPDTRRNWQRYLPWLAVALVVGAAVIVRMYGANFGLPYSEEIDEPAVMDHAIKMVVRGDPNPHWFLYPTLYIYIQAAVAWLFAQWAIAQGMLGNISELGTAIYDWRFLPQPELYLWGRLLTAVFGAGTVLALYLAGAQLYSKTVGVVASVLLAFTHLHVQYSHYIRTDIPLTFFITLSLYFSARLFRTGKLSDYILAGVCFGLAVSSKYTAALFVVTLLAAHLVRVMALSKGPNGSKRTWLNLRLHLPLLIGLAASLAAFFLTTPFALVEWDVFWYGIRDDAKTYSFLTGTLENAGYYFSYFQQREGFGALLTPLALAGIGIALWRHRAVDWIALSFPFVYFVFILVSEKANIRTALPLTPFLGLFAALAIYELAQFLSSRIPALRTAQLWLVAGITLVLLLAPVQKVLAFDTELAQATPRMLATQWAEQNLPASARIWSEPDAVWVPQANMLPSAELDGQTLESLRGERIDYVITADAPEGAQRSDLETALLPIKQFTPPDSSTLPTIRIFQVPAENVPLALNASHFEPKRYQPGESVALTMDWRVLAALRDDPAVVLNFVGPDGQTGFEYQESAERVRGRAKKWLAGSTVSDQYTVELPDDLKPGRYEIRVGLRNARTGSELSFGQDAGANQASLGALLVSPPPPAAQDAPETQASAVFGQDIKLHGYTVRSCELGAKALGMDLYWSAEHELNRNLTRFVHLLDAQGNLVAQHDSEPANGAFPTSVWDAGTLFEDRVNLDLGAALAPGTYTVTVGWYEYPSMQHLALPDGSDALKLMTVSCQA